MTRMRTRALIFDFDGLLVETEGPVYHAWREVYEAHGLELTLETWGLTIGRADHLDPFDELERQLGRRLDRDAVNEERRGRGDAPLDGHRVSPAGVGGLSGGRIRGLGAG